MSHRRLTVFAPILLSLVALLLTAGCGGGSDSDDLVLAEIGDRTVTAEYYKTRLVRMQDNQLPRNDEGQPLDMSGMEGKRAFLDVIVDKELMVSKALQLGYDDDTQIDQALGHLTEYNAMIIFWQDEIGDPSKYVSEADLDYYYSRLGERRDCDFLITDTEKQALEARAEVTAGVPWSEAVARFHTGQLREGQPPTIKVPWGQYRDEFERPIFEVAKGEVTPPIMTEHGWWLLRVNDVVMEAKPDLESIKGKVLASIAKRNENLRREDLVNQAAAKHKLVVNEEALRIAFEGLPETEHIIDPVTQQPVPADQLKALVVPTEHYDMVLMSYELSTGPFRMTIADFKSTFDKQNVFERPKKAEMLGSLRTKLMSGAERSIMVDEARIRDYFEDERVREESYRRIEEMLVDKVHKDVVAYEEFVSPEEMEAFWADHSTEYAKPERRNGHMVRCADRATAESARDGILSGDATWKAVNKKFGNDPDLEKRFGRIIQMTANDPNPVRETLFALEVGAMSDPFEIPGGWAVVQLDQIDEPTQPTMAEASEMVGQRIRNIRMDDALRTLLAEWRAEFGVTIHEDRLAEMPSREEAMRAMQEAANEAAVSAN